MTISALAASLLTQAAAALTDPPARQLVTVGPPTDPLPDGEQLAVGWMRCFVGVPGREDPSPGAQCWGPQCAELIVRLVRCSPTSTGVQDTNAADMTTAASALMDDGEDMRAGLRTWTTASVVHQDDLWIGPLVAVRSTGLVMACQVAVHVVL